MAHHVATTARFLAQRAAGCRRSGSLLPTGVIRNYAMSPEMTWPSGDQSCIGITSRLARSLGGTLLALAVMIVSERPVERVARPLFVAPR